MKEWLALFYTNQGKGGDMLKSPLTDNGFSLLFPNHKMEYFYGKHHDWSEKICLSNGNPTLVINEKRRFADILTHSLYRMLWENTDKQVLCLTLMVEERGELRKEFLYTLDNITTKDVFYHIPTEVEREVHHLLNEMYEVLSEDKRYRLPLLTGNHPFRWENKS